MRRHGLVYAWCVPRSRGITDLERQAIRSAVVAELERSSNQAASLACRFDDIVAAAELSNTDDEHDPEGTTIAFERAQVSALHTQAIRDAAALQRTLAELVDEEFGACERCRGPIGFERLVALPATRRCVECAR
jgi:DnaK suppressor protein